MADEPNLEDVAHLPGRLESTGIADWADARRTDGEFAEPLAPRTVADGGRVELREVTAESVREICALQVAPAQRRFVAPNAVSFAEALFEPKAWYRAVVADDVIVGFVMLGIDTETPEYYLWRLMIDARWQRRGYGRAAVEQVIAHVRTLPNARELIVSWVPSAGGPEPLYLGLGFEPTGEVDAGEIVARREL